MTAPHPSHLCVHLCVRSLKVLFFIDRQHGRVRDGFSVRVGAALKIDPASAALYRIMERN